MAKVRIMFVGQGPSGLPVDRVVNVWHFTSALNYSSFQPTCEAAVASFYNLGAAPQPVGRFLSPWVSRDALLLSYDLETAKPRQPITAPLTLPAVLSSSGAVEEAAVCLSLLGAPPITRRRRGRMFFGPLNAAGISPGTTSQPARPTEELIGALAAGFVQVKADTDGGTAFGWCIRSVTPAENFVRIETGYVDDAMDTIRRRGPRTTSRISFPATP